jgi:hypothetical protein
MILMALLLQAAAPQTAVDAERAFNAAAQSKGQWTAFRAFAAPEATMFVPQPVKVQAWLKDRKDPPKSVQWWPTASYVSCDGKLAVNTGGWQLADGSVGYFTTVWRKEADGQWKWLVDGGAALKAPRSRGAPKIVHASCKTDRTRPPYPPGAYSSDSTFGSGKSPDGTLHWSWTVWPDGKRLFTADLWLESRSGDLNYEPVIENDIAAPAK